jgi:ABC-type glycerol-3-phosphate transport system substrate-binding protein
MYQPIVFRIQKLFMAGIAMLVLLLLLSACTGVTGTGTSGTSTLTGTVVSVNPAQHSTVMNVNGQQVTVTGLILFQEEDDMLEWMVWTHQR